MSPRCRLVVLGAPASGKTALMTEVYLQVQSILGGQVLSTYDPTIEDRHRLCLRVEDSSFRVEITDTSGKELFPGMTKKYCDEGDGYIVVYSVKNRKSLREAVRICHLLGRKPRILVGCKCDVPVSSREVSLSEGRIVAFQLNCSFSEASAVSAINVTEVFEEIVCQVQNVRDTAKKELRRPPCSFL